MVPNIEKDYILLLGYSISYKEYNLIRFNHQKSTTQKGKRAETGGGHRARSAWSFGSARAPTS